MPRLSDSAFASLITCGPGDEFYTTFGHSAIRINDSVNNIDVVYNYGTFDFDTPHFYWKFARGRLNYCLSRSSFDNFMFEYSMEGRAVWEQRLRLSSQELNNLFIALETNYMPQYRYYLYDFFRDNCATRVRDMVFHSLCHRSVSPETTTDTNLSYRNILYRSTAHCLLWWRLGIDMALGLRCDKRCSNYEYMFSPIEMMHQFDTSSQRLPRSSILCTPLGRPLPHHSRMAPLLEPPLVRPLPFHHRFHPLACRHLPLVLHRTLLHQVQSQHPLALTPLHLFCHSSAPQQPLGGRRAACHAFCRHGHDVGGSPSATQCLRASLGAHPCRQAHIQPPPRQLFHSSQITPTPHILFTQVYRRIQ